MKKTTLFLSFVMCAFLVNAQTVVFNETFGTDIEERPSVNDYRGWDNASPVAFSCTTERYCDLRKTSALNMHVWFGANYEIDFLISNISTAGYTNLKLSFDIACNNAGGNANKVTLTCNGTVITVPSVPVGAVNTYVSSGELSIPDADVTNLRFLYTAANNPSNYGYRLDNVKITGVIAAGIDDPSVSAVFRVSDNHLIAPSSVTDGTVVEIYNALGKRLQTSVLSGGSIELENLSKGIHIVRAGAYTQKIVF